MRWMALGVLAACTDGKDTTTAPTPTLEFLSPSDGETVPAGDVTVSIVVTDFTLVPPDASARVMPSMPLVLMATTAFAHNEGTAEGYVELSLDGAVVAQIGDTQAVLPDVAAGAHSLSGALYYSDGDAIGAPVTISFTTE